MVVCLSQTIASGYGDLTFGAAELEVANSLRIPGITLDSKLTFETHLQEIMSKAARSLEIWR